MEFKFLVLVGESEIPPWFKHKLVQRFYFFFLAKWWDCFLLEGAKFRPLPYSVAMNKTAEKRWKPSVNFEETSGLRGCLSVSPDFLWCSPVSDEIRRRQRWWGRVKEANNSTSGSLTVFWTLYSACASGIRSTPKSTALRAKEKNNTKVRGRFSLRGEICVYEAP